MMKRILRDLTGVLIIAAIAGGCETPAAEPERAATGKAAVSLAVQGAAGLSPADPFGRYEVSFTPEGGGAAWGPAALDRGSGVVELAAGTYTVSAAAYAGTEAAASAIAVGGLAAVTVKAGEQVNAALTLGPRTGGADGTLSYDLTTPGGASGALTVSALSAADAALAGAAPPAAELAAGRRNAGTLSLAPGAYRLRAALGDLTVLEEDLFIYTGLTSAPAARTLEGLSAGDPENPDSPDAPEGPDSPDYPQAGSLAIGIGFGYGELAISGSDGTNLIGPGGSLTLTASDEFSSLAWYVDGSSTARGTALTLTLNAADYTARPHTVSFTGVKDGRPYSRLIPFAVAETALSPAERVGSAGLAAYLAGLPPNTPETPHTVVIDPSVDINNRDEWGTAMRNTIIAAERYLVLDLSACTPRDNKVRGFIHTDGLIANNPNARFFDWMGSYMGDLNDYAVGVILPASLIEIDDSAFSGWKALRSVSIPAGVTRIGSSAFSGCTGLESITPPAGLTAIGRYAFSSSGLRSVIIPPGVDAIEEGTFFDCPSLTSVSVPQGVKTIGNGAFESCPALTGIILPPGISSLGRSAFSRCTALKTAVIGEGPVIIYTGTFRGCTSLKSITLPSTLHTIDIEAFQGSGLTAITIPPGVRVIYYGAFTGAGLTRISFEGYSPARLGVNNGLAGQSASFPSGFDEFYNAQSVKAGTYVYAGGSWRKQN
jgi:hypothetical protein